MSWFNFKKKVMRRLPVYLLIDTSGSMNGEPIESVKVGLEAMFATLKNDPFALETVYVSIITFDRDVKEIMPLTSVDELVLPNIETPDAGPTHLGAALQLLLKKLDREIIRNSSESKGDWLPLLLIMTDGKPSDLMLFEEMAQEIKKRTFAKVIACAAGPLAKVEPLKNLTNDVYTLGSLDSNSFVQLFQWVSSSIDSLNRSQGVSATDDSKLPELPPEIILA